MYNLEIGIPDFLWRNIRDNRLPQTSRQKRTWPRRATGSLGLIYNHPYKHIKRLYFILGTK